MSNAINAGDANNAPGGPRGDQGWVVWDKPPSAYRCPSDPIANGTGKGFSYALCVGDQAFQVSNGDVRGLYGRWKWKSIGEITDGTSNTIGIPGEYSVKVFKFEKGTGPVDPKAPPMTFEEEQKLPSTNEKPAPPAKNLLPAKYADHLTSGLSHTVGDSPSTFDIELK